MPTDQAIAEAGQKVFEMFGACGEAPDDVKVGKQADKALERLEKLLNERDTSQ
ncbi:hypothetical protein Rhe02_01310 [Rhizocola hellebori]|uniref:Uncharacterized protein n=1 Tax=Rhizocola hellebori TaxID=1392758 RepID=A0A8J3VBX5_9ACTN|nr:hypothetical protein [Rhizocola hellebori]GIH02064.1 hypothetical protein Rhe02_01310 [Rhizocola hellebori]